MPRSRSRSYDRRRGGVVKRGRSDSIDSRDRERVVRDDSYRRGGAGIPRDSRDVAPRDSRDVAPRDSMREVASYGSRDLPRDRVARDYRRDSRERRDSRDRRDSRERRDSRDIRRSDRPVRVESAQSAPIQPLSLPQMTAPPLSSLIPPHVAQHYLQQPEQIDWHNPSIVYQTLCAKTDEWLPPGWERVEYKGAVVYLDHLTREAYEEKPWEVWARKAKATR